MRPANPRHPHDPRRARHGEPLRANNQRQPKGSVTIANYYQLSPTPLIIANYYQLSPTPLICHVYLQLLLIGIDLVIQAPKSPEFSYTVFYGIAWYYVVLKYIQLGEILTFFLRVLAVFNAILLLKYSFYSLFIINGLFRPLALYGLFLTHLVLSSSSLPAFCPVPLRKPLKPDSHSGCRRCTCRNNA